MTVSAAAPFTPVLRLADETFDPASRSFYGLYLVLRADGGVRLAALDTNRNKFVALEDYERPAGPDVIGTADAAAALATLAASHGWLGNRGWRHVRVAVQHPRFTLLPRPLFRKDDAAELLRLQCDFDSTREQPLWYVHAPVDMVAVFAAEKTLPDWLNAAYGAGVWTVLHHTSPLLEGALHQPQGSDPAVVSLHVTAGLLTLSVVRQRRLEFCNVFSFSTPEDLLYYTILVLQECQLTPEATPVTVWGDVAHDASILLLLRRYIRTVRLGTRPTDLQYSYRFDEAFPHRFFELFNLALCE